MTRKFGLGRFLVMEPEGKSNPIQAKLNGTKIWWRHWSVVFILAVLAAFVIWALIKAGPWLRDWQGRRTADALRKQAEEQLRNDEYGGKTPEETFDMFIAALEKGDVELASKYFVVQKQEQWRKTIQEYKNRQLITDFVSELKKEKNNWERLKSEDLNTVEFSYSFNLGQDTYADFRGQKVLVKAGEHNNTVMFQKYPNGIWKINVL